MSIRTPINNNKQGKFLLALGLCNFSQTRQSRQTYIECNSDALQ